MTVYCDVAPCSLVGVYRYFRGPYCLHHQGSMEAASTSETSVNLQQTTRRNIPEDNHPEFLLNRNETSDNFVFHIMFLERYNHLVTDSSC
jgi:hypothetical protein